MLVSSDIFNSTLPSNPKKRKEKHLLSVYPVRAVPTAGVRNRRPAMATADAHTRVAARFVIPSLGRGVFLVTVPVPVSVLIPAPVLVPVPSFASARVGILALVLVLGLRLF